MGTYSGLSRLSDVTTRVLVSDKGKEEGQRLRRCDERSQSGEINGLEGGRVHEPREAGGLQQLEKTRKHSGLERPEGLPAAMPAP